MKKPYEIIDVSVCSNCRKMIEPGTIICPGCGKKNPKIEYDHIILNIIPSKAKWLQFIKKEKK